MRSSASLCCLMIAWGFSVSAHAFPDAPLCALEPVLDEAEAMCLDRCAPLSMPAANACEPPAPQVTNALLCFWPGPAAGSGLHAPDLDVDRETARASYAQAQEMLESGKLVDALLHLRVVERSLPAIADRIALERGDLLVRLAMPEQAREAYAIAAKSPERGVAARAEIGEVRCAIAAGERSAETALRALLRRYPLLPERHLLEFELAMTKTRAGQASQAAALLRGIDLDAPASPVAARARAELELLRKAGVHVKPYSGTERVDRAERLMRKGPIDEAAAEIQALASVQLSAEARARVQQLSARIAKLQGRFDQAVAELQRAHEDGAPLPDQADGKPASDSVGDARSPERIEAERRVRSIKGRRPVARLRTAQIRMLFDIAVHHRMRELCDETIEVLATRKRLPPAVRFEAAMLASGLASDDKLAKLLETLVSVPRYRVAARYHHARALERLQRFQEAEAEYIRVIAQDRGLNRYYAMWADQRLWNMQSSLRASCIPDAAGVQPSDSGGARPAPGLGPTQCGGAPFKHDMQPAATASRAQPNATAASSRLSLIGTVVNEGTAAVIVPATRAGQELEQLGGRDDAAGISPPAARQDPASPQDPGERRRRALALLQPIAERHGAAYPWLSRAVDLIAIERFEEAADELSEAYLAFRDVTGAPRLRSGLVALMTGNAPPRRAVTPALRRSRRSLDHASRKTLSKVARLVGDPGIGLRFGDFRLSDQPRAYADLVERAARKHGIDPNLLFAVMRVESIYNRRIISHVGAVGLMQIMPHTGLRIATRLGIENFETSDLLDPALNLDFSAWYLASLIKRFDGHLPLAVASYNGGPHNVRQWMHSSPPDMPLDAFLERIPFSQTHRYVRRVLTFYAMYRAQQNLPMTRLSVELPRPKPDDIAF